MKLAKIKTHFEIGKSIIRPDQLVERLKKDNYDGAILCDTTLAGSVEFFKEMTKAKLKPIIGLAVGENVKIAKSKDDWRALIREFNGVELSECEEIPLESPAVYLSREDAIDHRVNLAIGYESTFENLQACIDDHDLKYLSSDDFFLKPVYLDIDFADFSILEKPQLPKFKEGADSAELLRELCREGWRKRIQPKNLSEAQQKIYTERVNYELDVLNKAGLADYFLIVADILKFVRDSGQIHGISRGSAGGCLVSYLTGATLIDPIQYSLYFERFYDESRSDSLPDFDMDLPPSFREQIIDYVRKKYGQDRVVHMCTYNTIKGRGAVQDVLRVRGGASPEERIKITKPIPDEAKIADQLQVMEEEGDTPSIIWWSLKNRIDKLREWCYINEEGNLDGPLSKRFEQAIRLEGTIKSRGKHAAAITIAAHPLQDICPLIFDDKSGHNITGVEMKAVESLGILKLDCLSISYLDKVMTAAKLIEARHENVG